MCDIFYYLLELISDYKEKPELLSETAPIGPDLGTAPNLRGKRFFLLNWRVKNIVFLFIQEEIIFKELWI